MIEFFYMSALRFMSKCDTKLKRDYYLKRLGKYGAFIQIDRRAALLGNLSNMTIGDRVKLQSDVILDCRSIDSSISIGDNSVIKNHAMLISISGNIEIGCNCTVNPFSVLYSVGNLHIGNDVRIAANVCIIPTNHIFDNPTTTIRRQGLTKKGISIGNDIWIGAGARILDGVTIGDGAVIGAGAVVTKNVLPFSVSVGIPARQIHQRGMSHDST